jgi:hypothetical protein
MNLPSTARSRDPVLDVLCRWLPPLRLDASDPNDWPMSPADAIGGELE